MTMKLESKKILIVVVAVIGQFIIMLGVSFFNQYFLMDFTLTIRIILMFICQWIFLPVPIFLMYKSKEKLHEIGFAKDKILRQILIGLLIAIAMCLIFTVIPILLGQQDMVSDKRYSQAWQFAFEFAYAIFGVAIAEEFFFRGYLFKKLLDFKDSKLLAILVSSLVFGLFHVFRGGLIQVLGTSIIAVIYCLCREKIKHCTLLSLIIAHGVYDALIVLCVSLI